MKNNALDVFSEKTMQGKTLTYKELQAALAQALQDRAANAENVNELNNIVGELLTVICQLYTAHEHNDSHYFELVMAKLENSRLIKKTETPTNEHPQSKQPYAVH